MLNLPAFFQGMKIFPVVPGGKLPATKNGWQDASADPAQIAEWQKVNPDFNWGIAAGSNGLFVFDVDPAGLDWWHKLLERDATIKAAVDAAYQVRTPRGGLHVYFKGEGPSTASRIAEGIDTRGGFWREGKLVSGGYVVLPGSKTDKGIYEALPGGAINPLPAPLRGIIPERKKHDVSGLARDPTKDQPRNVQWATDLLKNYVQSGRVSIQGQGGNNLAYQVIASVLDKAISPALCFDLIWDLWNPSCVPPWDEHEIDIIIQSAMKSGDDTASGVKGFQANTDAFANFAGQEFEAPTAKDRDHLQWLHDYADGVRDPEWLIPGILPAQGTGMIFGESGSYKSFLTLDMALCLAFGVAGQWGAPPVKNDVLFIAGEGPIQTAKKRWPAWMEWQGLEFRNDHRFILKDRVPFYTDTDGWENVKADLGALNAKPALIVIDTLTRLLVGLDENSTKDASMITDFMEKLARYYECFVLAVHHTGKDQSKGARGSSAFYANMDMVVSTKLLQGGTEFRIRKQKDADVPDDKWYFAPKEFGQSIVLQRTDNLMEKSDGKGPAYKWATSENIVTVLQSLGGEADTAILVGEIVARHGIADKNIVIRQLDKNSDLTWLRPTRNKWQIPVQEFDL